jgi:hypothetical protein
MHTKSSAGITEGNATSMYLYCVTRLRARTGVEDCRAILVLQSAQQLSGLVVRLLGSKSIALVVRRWVGG